MVFSTYPWPRSSLPVGHDAGLVTAAIAGRRRVNADDDSRAAAPRARDWRRQSLTGRAPRVVGEHLGVISWRPMGAVKEPGIACTKYDSGRAVFSNVLPRVVTVRGSAIGLSTSGTALGWWWRWPGGDRYAHAELSWFQTLFAIRPRRDFVAPGEVVLRATKPFGLFGAVKECSSAVRPAQTPL